MLTLSEAAVGIVVGVIVGSGTTGAAIVAGASGIAGAAIVAGVAGIAGAAGVVGVAGAGGVVVPLSPQPTRLTAIANAPHTAIIFICIIHILKKVGKHSHRLKH